MIYVLKNVYHPEDHYTIEFSGALIDLLQTHWPQGFSGHSAIYVNGVLLPVEDYDADVSDDDRVVIMPDVPAGLETATIYLLVQIAVLLVSVALSFLLMPKQPKSRGGKGRVYSIGSGQNVPALGEIIAEHFGRCWFFPDVASQPYVQYINNDQFVYQLLLIGSGEYRIDNIRVGNTPLASIPAGLVDYRVYGPADHKSQFGVIQQDFNLFEDVISSTDVQGLDFARNANTSFAGKAYSDNKYIEGTEVVSGFSVGDVVTLLAEYSDANTANHNKTTTITSISGTRMYLATLLNDAGNPKYQVVKEDIGWRGWFDACPIGKTTDRIDLDIEFPQGLFYTDDDGDLRNMSTWIDIEIQQIDDNSVSIGAPITAQKYFKKATRDPMRFTFSYAVPAGRYKVRLRRNNADDIVSRNTSKVFWNGLKAYAINTPGQFAYGNVTILAIKMKASEALSSASDKISVEATRILPTVASNFTVKAPTTNVCDAFAQVVRDTDPLGVDVPSLQELATRWAGTNGFNFRFEDRTTVYSALQTIALSHRAQPQAYARLLSMRPDDAKPFDQFVISQEQMRVDSYRCGVNIGLVNSDIDGYRVGYQDPNGTTILYAAYPVTALSPEEVTLDGCTNVDTAVAQAKFLYARKQVLRRVVSFETEFDALCFSIGDRISVVSNVLDNVRTVRVLSQAGNVLTVDGVMEAPEAKVRVRDEYGQPSDLISASMTGNQLTLAALPPFPIYGIDAGQESTTVVIGAEASFNRSYTVTEISPSSSSVSVSATSYSPVPYLFPIPGEVIP